MEAENKWDGLDASASKANDTAALQAQYADAGNFRARMVLNKRFSRNKQGWNRWIFERMLQNSPLREGSRVLELGCGPGYLWKMNADRLPQGAAILLSDFSGGMLDAARRVLGAAAAGFAFKIIDAERIPEPDGAFDVVLASLMLYHVPDRRRAIGEMRRVLREDGVLYVTTIGSRNMIELVRLFRDCFGLADHPGHSVAGKFGLENGMAQLREQFGSVELLRYEDALEVTEAAPLLDYLLSTKGITPTAASLTPERIATFQAYLEALIKRDGKISITKDSGLFIARK